jgi:hypothetical protein
MQVKVKLKGLLWSSELQYYYKYSLTDSEVRLYHTGAIGFCFNNLYYYSIIALIIYASLFTTKFVQVRSLEHIQGNISQKRKVYRKFYDM